MPWPEDLSQVTPHLRVFGYIADDAGSWRIAPAPSAGARKEPHLELGVTGHREVDGHTMYTVRCSLALRGARHMEWEVARPLARFRTELHDGVKAELADAYAQHFDGAPFAPRGGLPGTTARLAAWSAALASCINSGGAPPRVVALTLRFLEVPEP